MTERTSNDGPTGGRTLAGDMTSDETVGGGPLGERPVAGDAGSAAAADDVARGGPDLPEHADQPELLGGPGDGLSAERRSRA